MSSLHSKHFLLLEVVIASAQSESGSLVSPRKSEDPLLMAMGLSKEALEVSALLREFFEHLATAPKMMILVPRHGFPF